MSNVKRIATNRTEYGVEWIEQHENGVLFWCATEHVPVVDDPVYLASASFPISARGAEEFMTSWGRELDVSRLPFPIAMGMNH